MTQLPQAPVAIGRLRADKLGAAEIKQNIMKNIALTLILLLLSLPGLAQRVSSPQEISVAGFFPLEGSGRQVYNFNPGWRFYRGDVKGAEAADFNDRDWEVVSTPHSVQLMPAEASGCRNYQGIAWYRKHFTVPPR